MRRRQLVVIDAVNHGQIDTLAGGRDQDLLRAGIDMGLGLIGSCEEPGAFHLNFDTQLGMRQLGGIAFSRHPDALAVHHKIVAVRSH